MRTRIVRAEVVGADHMLRGHVVEVTGRGRDGRVFALDPAGVELTFATSDLREVA
jgi:hypothetical protein